MIPVLDARGMRSADAATIRSGIASDELMESAAAGLCEELERAHPGWRRIVAVCGPGNNGGDGLAAARLLFGMGKLVSVYTLVDPAAYRGDARANLDRLRSTGVRLARLDGRGAFAELRRGLADSDGVVDALFGTGLSRPLTGGAAAAVRTILRSGRAVVSADVPSGLSSDGGTPPGVAVRADITVAFGAPKLCHVL